MTLAPKKCGSGFMRFNLLKSESRRPNQQCEVEPRPGKPGRAVYRRAEPGEASLAL